MEQVHQQNLIIIMFNKLTKQITFVEWRAAYLQTWFSSKVSDQPRELGEEFD